jgi:hypothetical protein
VTFGAHVRCAGELRGVVSVMPTVPPDGKTDPQILTELLLAAEIAENTIAEVLRAAVAEAEPVMALAEADLRRHGQVIRGVVEILQRIATLPDMRQTLVTGP